MLWKMLKKDIIRNIGVTAPVFFFIALSALLAASGSFVAADLFESINDLFEKAKAPDFVQMHAGGVDQARLDGFAEKNALVKEQQTLEMLNIDGSSLYFKDQGYPQSDSVMDISFVTQSPSFDLLLDLNSEPLSVGRGEIAVPIYFMQVAGLKVGDSVRVADGGFSMGFVVSDYVRDATMNPSIVSSKRFVVNEADFADLKANTGETEYLIEFMLDDASKTGEFTNMYADEGLPQKGPAIGGSMFKIMNAISNGVVVAILMVVSLLLVIVSMLCLRFTFIATVEEDYREIGVMKAIGIKQKNIARMYLFKYALLSAAACAIGYLASLLVGDAFTADAKLYFGASERGAMARIVPFVAAGSVFLLIFLFSRAMLGRFRRVSAIEAVRSGQVAASGNGSGRMRIHKKRFVDVNVLLGIQEALLHFKLYRIVLVVFTICVFIIMVPLNLYNTVNSPRFISYMGVGRSDVRIDLQLSEGIGEQFVEIADRIGRDPEVEKHAGFVTCQYKVYNAEDGAFVSVNVEIGDFAAFPIDYLNGRAPSGEREIALSALEAADLNAGVGDQITAMLEGGEASLTVCGIYQDLTNGGRSAKALLPVDEDTVLWYVIAADFAQGVDARQKTMDLRSGFPGAKITEIDEYVFQSMGGVVSQVRIASFFASMLAMLLAALITAMFLKMLVAKEKSQAALMKCLGFTAANIQTQYISRMLTVLVGGVLLGALSSKFVGELLVGGILSMMGASKFTFDVNVFQAYIALPAVFLLVVGAATFLASRSVRSVRVSECL